MKIGVQGKKRDNQAKLLDVLIYLGLCENTSLFGENLLMEFSSLSRPKSVKQTSYQVHITMFSSEKGILNGMNNYMCRRNTWATDKKKSVQQLYRKSGQTEMTLRMQYIYILQFFILNYYFSVEFVNPLWVPIPPQYFPKDVPLHNCMVSFILYL